MLAFLFRNPGISSYEVFGALFAFTGSTVLFALLGIVLRGLPLREAAVGVTTCVPWTPSTT